MLKLDDEFRLSYYREIADIDPEHGIFLVQDVRSGKLYVKKNLTVYNREIFEYLMTHPVKHTPRIYELVEDGDLLILIEEYIPGDTLQELLEQKGKLPEPLVVNIAIQLCGILEEFHACQPPIVNRDIKPSNIKLTDDGIVKLLDMNAAKWYNEQSRRDTVLIGTQGYAAPEQYGFGSSSVLTDIYSVGVLMNELLTGQLNGGRAVNSKLRHIISKCTELSPKERYQSAASLRSVLESLQRKEEKQKKPDWRRFLPPGFRSDEPICWLFASVGYIFLFYLCWTLEVENVGALELLINRVAVTLVSVLIVLFSGNYLNVQSKTFLTRSKFFLLRLIGIVIIDVLILFGGVFILTLAESYLL